jgi:site-specific recombinase XerD
LAKVSSGQRVDPAAISVADIVDHIGDLTCRYRPAPVELAASALRSFFRFLRAEGPVAQRPAGGRGAGGAAPA